MRVLGCNCFRHVLGQLELIGKGNTLPWWANARVSLNSPPDVAKLCRPTQQSHMLACFVLNGPTRAICCILESMKWTRASGLVQLCPPCSGPIRPHRMDQPICMAGHCKHFANHASPYNSLACCPIVCLMGQHKLFVVYYSA